ncbi:hypothetical protein GQ85_19270 [Rhodococcus rhodochrous]|nr:hypothetical protein GQ85_19270 [Rhodococcus rhodochrous]
MSADPPQPATASTVATKSIPDLRAVHAGTVDLGTVHLGTLRSTRSPPVDFARERVKATAPPAREAAASGDVGITEELRCDG